jgi:transcriptional regulator with XRE-family HTH domain
MMPVIDYAVLPAKQALALRARRRRLAENLSRRTLAERSGVAESMLKKFETTGDISLHSLLAVASALGDISGFGALFPERPARSIELVTSKVRLRGRS